MRKAIGTDRRRDPHRVLDVLHEIDADIVALQEADKRFGGRGSAVPHELIDSHSHYKPVHIGVRHKRPLEKARRHAERLLKVDTRNLGWHGNAILVKSHVGVIDCAAMCLSFGLARTTAASILSCRRQNRMSAFFTACTSVLCGMMRLSSG